MICSVAETLKNIPHQMFLGRLSQNNQPLLEDQILISL